ncbi:ESX secretion-associated protein EspG [Nocardia asiatica]|uniref:ESX secretion-associated protein EspG n=1 Tax=Nocardia asiatica TaxID=209252 RepID=UPI002453DA4D|nr:ESX secretion-associated protein EspG [Nocardia asiatica]
MSRSWTLTDLEFVVSWERTGEEILPEPLFFVSRTRLLADAEREKRATAAGLRVRSDGLPDQVLACLVRPDIRITVVATDHRDPHNPGSYLRLLGVRRGDTGYLVTQLPGESVRYCGGYTIAEGEALALATMVVDALPVVGAGRHTGVVLPNDDLEFDSAVRERGHRFLRLPTAMAGEIRVCQGSSVFGPRGLASRTLRWRDVVGDGRYVIAGDPPAAVPADGKRLTVAVNHAVASVVAAIREERE